MCLDFAHRAKVILSEGEGLGTNGNAEKSALFVYLARGGAESKDPKVSFLAACSVRKHILARCWSIRGDVELSQERLGPLTNSTHSQHSSELQGLLEILPGTYHLVGLCYSRG
jgi:hypothetical protein